jgi:hypothetical protein
MSEIRLEKGVLSAAWMHGGSREVPEKDMIKIWLKEGAPSATEMDGESMEVLEEEVTVVMR